MKTLALTDLEKTLILNITEQSQWDLCSLDFSKDWNDQELECDCFEDFCDVKDYSKRFNMSVKTVKGVLGSLQKKDLISIQYENIDCNALFIDEKRFNKIKELLNK